MCSASDSAQAGGLAVACLQLAGQLVEPGAQARDLPLAYLLGQPLQPFQPLADVFQRARVRALVRDVVLDGPREQLAHAVGGASLVPANQDVVARLIHDAPLRGVALPRCRHRPLRMAPAPDNSSSYT